MCRRSIIPSLIFAALMAGAASPAYSQISVVSGPKNITAHNGFVFKFKAAFDPVNQVYLVVWDGGPTSGQFLDQLGNRIGGVFPIANVGDPAGWTNITFGGPPDKPRFLVTYMIGNGTNNPKMARLVQYTPNGPIIGLEQHVTDLGGEWPDSDIASPVWTGTKFAISWRWFGASLLRGMDIDGNLEPTTQSLGDGLDAEVNPVLACGAGVCLAHGFAIGAPFGSVGGSWARFFSPQSLAPIGGVFYLDNHAGIMEDQRVAYNDKTGQFQMVWVRQKSWADFRLVAPNGQLGPLDLTKSLQGGQLYMAYNSGTQTSLVAMLWPDLRVVGIELGDDGYPIRDANNNPQPLFVSLSWEAEGSPPLYYPWPAANPLAGQWLVAYSSMSEGRATIVQGTLASAVSNGTFNNGLTGWTLFATPDSQNLVTRVNNGVLEFYRLPNSGQGVVFQPMGVPLAAKKPISAQFDIGNSSTVPKRITVLLHDLDFSDLQVCSFWLAPGAPLRRYTMRSYSTKAWANATISFYATTAGSDGGAYLLDNVAVLFTPGQPTDRTDCVDPTVAPPPGGSDGPELITNGTFASGEPPWVKYGSLLGQVFNDGVFRWVRPAGNPAGAMLQWTNTPATGGVPLTATFQLGNSSSQRKRVTVLVHDADFSDLLACTFWLDPGQALQNYTMRVSPQKPWTNAALSFYLGAVDYEGWAMLDNVSLRATPGVPALGTECIASGTPGGEQAPTSETGTAAAPATIGVASATPTASTVGTSSLRIDPNAQAPLVPLPGPSTDWAAAGTFSQVAALDDGTLVWDSWVSGNGGGVLTWNAPVDLRQAMFASLRFASLRTGGTGSAEVQISRDGLTWETVSVVSMADGWTVVTVGLDGFVGQSVFVRLRHGPASAGSVDEWLVTGMTVIGGSPLLDFDVIER